MSVPKKIIELVERFRQNAQDYCATDYNETELRREFIDPFFKALGWDMDNERGAPQTHKDVVHEDKFKVAGKTKRPDYGFYIRGKRQFFLEAKKPAIDFSRSNEETINAALQLRDYGWSASLPLNILTNFRQFAVYDCRIKPSSDDFVRKARVCFCSYEEYPKRWDELYHLFSREAVLNNSLGKFLQHRKSNEVISVDAAFLKDIELWRETLAINLFKRHPELDTHELNFAVQMTLNRIIFLRICEDIGIEHYHTLENVSKKSNIYKSLGQLFKLADRRYNSGLFHFRRERSRSTAYDEWTLSLTIDDKVLARIIKNLYPPKSRYKFDVIPVEILGQVYEQFLGQVITLSHGLQVEEKPEVKKAGGVYYTPTYIVDHIVEKTVGKLLVGKTPQQVSKLKILDPACGSGSFLIGAYTYLLNWHRDYYIKHQPQKYREAIVKAGDWQLTSHEKKRILLNNIYGVDIDSQAVEITKLSLLLKVLEGESQRTIDRQLKLFKERALPDLDNNIQFGNSLIGIEFYENKRLLGDEETMFRVNAFNWDKYFAEIVQAGGFDAVIGNPPYIRIQSLKEWASLEVEFYKERYSTASQGNYDIYVVFVERGLQALNERGLLGFILPHKFFNAKYGQALRRLLAGGKYLSEIVHFGDQQVFSHATTYSCLLFLDKKGCDSFRFVKVTNLPAWREKKQQIGDTISAEKVTEGEWHFVSGAEAKLFERLKGMPVKLGDVAARMAQGIRTSANEVYVLDLVEDNGKLVQAYSKQLNRVVTLERDLLSLFLQGRDIRRYQILPSGKVVIIPYRIQGRKVSLILEKDLRKEYPNTYKYLKENQPYLENRERGRMQGAKNWYAYVYPKNIEIMATPKLLVPDIANRAAFAFDVSGEYAFSSGYGITLKDSTSESFLYILGLLNSKLLDFYLKQISTTLRGGFFRYFTQFIEQLPIRSIDFNNPADKAKHDEMVQLVDQRLTLQKQLNVTKMSQKKQHLQAQIESSEQQIDGLVYELYGLSDTTAGLPKAGANVFV